MSTRKRLAEIQAMIANLTGVEGWLVGGCVRDTLSGAEPRDYDYAVICPNFTDAEAFQLLEAISVRLSLHGIASAVHGAYGQGTVGDFSTDYVSKVNNFQGKWLGHLAFEHQNTKVDVLITGYNMRRLLAHFDCNMNRVCFNHGTKRIVGRFPTVLEFNENVPSERRAYMSDKFFKYWSTHDTNPA